MSHGPQTPNNQLMMYVASRFPPASLFLDIGSGSGANAQALRSRGFSVITLDSDEHAKPDVTIDIRAMNFRDEIFDCVLDINTLCHVENPPFEKIKSWLKPDGAFFCICPTENTAERVKEGKEFTRLVSEHELREMLKMFPRVKIGTMHYQIPDEPYYDSWIAEAQK